MFSLSLLLLRYTETPQPKSNPLASFIIQFKITLQKSCITGIFGQIEGEHNIKCN